jgi:uncharacterized membrane protein
MKNLLKYLFGIILFCLISLTVVITIYGTNFSGEVSNDQAIWGAFGDFVGGTLNPIFSFSGLIALLFTIVLQSRELEETRKELARSAEAHEKQVKYIAGQQQRDDLTRLVTKLTERINNNYNSNIESNMSIHGALIGIDSPTNNHALYILEEQMRKEGSKTYKIVQYLQNDLVKLHDVLKQYEHISTEVSGKPSPFKSFYISEYTELVTRFIKYGWFNEQLNRMYC